MILAQTVRFGCGWQQVSAIVAATIKNLGFITPKYEGSAWSAMKSAAKHRLRRIWGGKRTSADERCERCERCERSRRWQSLSSANRRQSVRLL